MGGQQLCSEHKLDYSLLTTHIPIQIVKYLVVVCSNFLTNLFLFLLSPEVPIDMWARRYYDSWAADNTKKETKTRLTRGTPPPPPTPPPQLSLSELCLSVYKFQSRNAFSTDKAEPE